MKPLDKVTGTLDALMAKGGTLLKQRRDFGPLSQTRVQQPSYDSELTKQFPKFSGAMEGLIGTAPDEMGDSVLDPNYAARRAGAEMTFPLGTAMQIVPNPVKAGQLAGKGAGILGKEAMRHVAQGMEGQGVLRGALAPAAQMNVVKPKGGNWLAGSVEKQMEPMLTKTGGGTHMDKAWADMQALYTPEALAAMSPETRAMAQQHNPALQQGSAINKWVKGNLTNYVKNEMATPQDPLRALAEKGISHLKPEPMPADIPYLLEESRAGTGFPAEGMGQSDLAKQWEALSDRSISNVPASHYQALEKYAVNKKMKEIQETDDLYKELGLDPKELLPNQFPMELPASKAYKENPWLAKVGEDTPIYSRNTSQVSQGFAHIVDVLKADLASGRIKPDQLNKVSMDQAVRRTVEYDQELAKKMEAARAASMEGMPIHKEYPEGYKWVQLKRPGEFAQESDVMGHSVRGYEPASGSPDWITTSGDEGSEYYGHGGWEGIKSGKAKVYSLRNPKGESHATIEVAQGQPRLDYEQTRAIQKQASDEANAKNFDFFHERDDFEKNRYDQLANELQDRLQNGMSSRITQIKGKQNTAPSEQYQPYIQDFVKGGQWSDVGDLSNTGLIKHPSGKYISKAEMDVLSKKHFGESMGNRPDSSESVEQYANRMSRYDPEMLSDTDKAFLADWQAGNFTPEEGMKRGGEVSRDQMMMAVEDQKFGIGGMVSKAAKAAKAMKEAEVLKAIAPIRASEALGKSEGLFLRPTQADRTRVGEGYLGGPGFSGLQLTDPAYRDAAAAWAVKNKGAAKTIVNANKMNEGKNVWSTMLGSPTQHHSNQMVFDTLHNDFMDKVAEGKLSPELREKINDKLAMARTKKGEQVFPENVDIASPEFKDIANTFDRRSLAATLMSGQTVGGKKGMIIDYPGHMKAASDPGLIDAPTGAIGNRLFTMSNEVMTRPDLHPAFPTVLAGEDLGMNYAPVPRNIMLPDYYKEFNTRKGRDPGVMDLTRGYAPSQQLSEEFLTSLQKQGYKKGGAVKHPRHDEFVAKIKKKITQVKKMAEGGAVDYNSTPDMSDGGQLIQAPAYKAGGKVKPQVKISNNLDTMLMELSNKRNK